MNFGRIRYGASQTLRYLGRNIITIIILLIGVYFFAKSVTRTVAEVAIAKRDTATTITHITQPTIYTQSYTPYRIKDTIVKQSTIIVPQEFKPSEDIAELKRQVTELSNRLFKSTKYRDTIHLKDTFGLVGDVNINDSVTQNKIANRVVDYTLFPREALIVTKFIPAKPITQFYLGPEMTLKFQNPIFNQAGLAAILKTKNDLLFKAGGGLQFEPNSTRPYISLGFYPKLSFK